MKITYSNKKTEKICEDYSKRITQEWKIAYDEIALHFESESQDDSNYEPTVKKEKKSADNRTTNSAPKQKGKGRKIATKTAYSLEIVGFVIAGVFLILIGIIIATYDKVGQTAAIPVCIVFGLIAGGGVIMGKFFNSYLKSYCLNCGKSMKGATEAEYQLKSDKIVGGSDKIHHEYVYNIRIVCPHCGNVKDFDEKFLLQTSDNPDYRVRNFLRSRYNIN